jgi:hypothetical protein
MGKDREALTIPTVRQDQVRARSVQPEHGPAIEVECLGNAAQRFLDGFINVVGWQVDEICRLLADQPVELHGLIEGAVVFVTQAPELAGLAGR